VIRLLLVGAGGHARVVLDAVRTRSEIEVVGFVGTDDDLMSLRANGATHAVVGLGTVQPGARRAELFERIRAAGLVAAVITHRDATVSPAASIGDGSVVLARAVVNPGARVGRNAIVNTGAIVEHDCEIGDHAHVSPGAVLGGGVRVGLASGQPELEARRGGRKGGRCGGPVARVLECDPRALAQVVVHLARGDALLSPSVTRRYCAPN